MAFSFSYYLHKSLNVPVAVVQTSWGSSSIEGWMPLDMTDQLPHFKNIMERFEEEDREKVAEIIKRSERILDSRGEPGVAQG